MCIPASAADAAAANPKGINALYANGLITFFNNGPSNLPKNPPDWIILLICALESFISVDVLLLKAFLIFVFSLVVNNNSYGKLLPLNISKLILKVVPVLLLTALLVFLIDCLII